MLAQVFVNGREMPSNTAGRQHYNMVASDRCLLWLHLFLCLIDARFSVQASTCEVLGSMHIMYVCPYDV